MKVINFIFRFLALVGLIIVVSAIVRWLTSDYVLGVWESHMPDESFPVDGEISSGEAMAQLRALVMFGNVIAHFGDGLWNREMTTWTIIGVALMFFWCFTVQKK